MTATYKEAIAFYNMAKEYLNTKGQKASALSYALSRTIKKLDSHIEDYNELVSDARSKYQKKDKDGFFEYYDDKNTQPKFLVSEHEKFRKEFREIQNKAFEFDRYLATSIPQDLDLVYYDYFVPFVIEDYPDNN